MKNKIALGLVLLTMMMSAVGCAKETKVHFKAEGIGDYEIMNIAEGVESFSMQDNDITVTVKKDGDYDFILKGDDGKTYTVVLSYHDGKAEVKSKDNIKINFDTK